MKIAAIDIGSNSVHMIIVEREGPLSFTTIDREKDMIKLGADTFRVGRLSDEAFASGLATLTRFKRLIDRRKVDVVLAAATSAVREALNGPAFLDAVHARTGILPRIISGLDEARLIHMAVCRMIDLSQRRGLLLDIGGGSVEATIGNAAGVILPRSLKLGVLRLRDRCGGEDPLSKDRRRQIEAHIREHAAATLAQAREVGFDLVVGTSGTILNLGLAAHLHRGSRGWFSPTGQSIRLDDLRELTEYLLKMNAAARAHVNGIDTQRSDTIHVGGLLLVTLLELARADSITLCDASVREGMVLDQLAQHAAQPDPTLSAIQRHSVDEMLRRFCPDREHAARVAALAARLFDQLQPLHRLSGLERRLLEFSCLLHDVGRFISFDRHEHHAYYLVRQGELRGFSEWELELIALTARYHRKSGPKGRHPEFAALRPRDRRTVRILAGILRVADGLDRAHANVVRSLRCTIGEEQLRIGVRATGDCDLELWAARRKATVLERALDRRILIEREEDRVEPQSET